jgi:hypothetical protein
MKSRQTNSHLLLFLLLVLALTLLTASLAACNTATTSRTGPTAADRITNGSPDPNLAATAQADQYWRDAQATTVSQQATQEANFRKVQGTAVAAQATKTAEETRAALHLALTVDAATVQAHQTADAATRSYEATSTAQARADAIATATEAAAVAQATSTAQADATAAALIATRQAWELEQERTQARRENIINAAVASGTVLLTVILSGLLLYLLYLLLPTLVNRASLVRYGQHGNPLFITQRDGRVIVTDPLRMHQAAITVDQEGNVNMPNLTDDAIQAILANGVLRTLIEQARHAPGHAPVLPSEVSQLRRLGPWTSQSTLRHDPGNGHKLLTLQAGTGSGQAETDETDQQLPLPTHVPWSLLAGHAGEGLALGAGPGHQLITLDLARLPHLFVAGMSGAGKTRRLMRPLVAQALAAGYYAVLLNESGSDFAPFYDHPNVAIVRGDVHRYMGVIEAAGREMERREALLRDVRVSEWGRLPNQFYAQQPFVLLAIDELLALAATLTPKEQKQFWALLTAFASRARKVGMCSMGLATDPTYRALGQGGLNYRSQCGRISFRMFQAAGSRAILDQNGAEQLEESQFLALLDKPGVQHGVAANPADEELMAFLARQTSRRYPLPRWLPAISSSAPNPPINRLPGANSHSAGRYDAGEGYRDQDSQSMPTGTRLENQTASLRPLWGSQNQPLAGPQAQPQTGPVPELQAGPQSPPLSGLPAQSQSRSLSDPPAQPHIGDLYRPQADFFTVPNTQILDETIADADRLAYFAHRPDDYKTLNAILTAIDADDRVSVGWNRNGEGFERLKRALRLRAQEGCEWAESIRGYPWQ